MAKSFKGGIDNLINPTSTPQGESPAVKETIKIVRANFVMNVDYHKKLKIIAAKEGSDLKDTLAKALDDFFIKKAHLLD